jgi:hypothetical protein
VQYMILIYGSEAGYAAMTPEMHQQAMQAFISYTQELAASGHMRAAGQLEGTHTATTVRAPQGSVHTTDGPFAETKEQLGGYYVIEVPTLDDAIAWASKCPAVYGGAVEIRPLVPLQ